MLQVLVDGPRALAAVSWPARATVTAVEGWQQADLVPARAYRPGSDPLILACGDGDLVHLARGHAGPVLVIADRPAGRLRDAGPVTDGLDELRRWLGAVVG